MLSSSNFRRENRVKRLDLSQLSFKTVSPRTTTTLPLKKNNSENSPEFKRPTLGRWLTSAPIIEVAPLTAADRAQSIEIGLPLSPTSKQDSPKGKFSSLIIQGNIGSHDEEKSAFNLQTCEKSPTRHKNANISTHYAHSKERQSPQVFGIKGAEILNRGGPMGSNGPLIGITRRKKIVLSFADSQLDLDAMKSFSPKGKSSSQLDSPKRSPVKLYPPRVSSIGFLEFRGPGPLLGLQNVASARQSSTHKLPMEDFRARMETDGLEKLREGSGSPIKRESNESKYGKLFKQDIDKKNQPKSGPDLQSLKCFLDTKMTWKSSLMKRPQYSLYKNIAQNRKAKDFKITSVDALKEFFKGVPYKELI